nr:AMP-binding protein [uncultured Mogibacterium sp.]
MSTNSMTETSRKDVDFKVAVNRDARAEYREIKAKEMEEMQAMMDTIKDSTDPAIRYTWRRAVTDIKNILETSAELYGDKPLFLQKFDKNKPFQEISYSKVLADVNALGTTLIELGLKDKHIGVIGKNCYEWAESYLAVVGGTGVVVPLDKELNEDELAQLTASGELSAVITMDKHYDIFKRIKDRDDNILEFVINVGMHSHEKENKGLLSWHKLREHGYELVESGDRSFIDAEIINTDMAIILFTSGTTGTSKGVMLNNKNICSNVMVAQTFLNIEVGDVFFSVLPIHHTYECTCTFIESMYCGATMAFCQGLKHIVKDLQEVKPHLMLAVPLIYENFYSKITRQIKKSGKEKQLNTLIKLSKVTKRVGIDVSKPATKKITETFGGRIKTLIVGGAAIDGDIMGFFRDLGITAIQGYGLTETSPMVSLNPEDPKLIDNASAGHLLPFVECMIADKGDDGIGEICFRGPNIMMGYYKNQESTDEVIKDGWFHTGDLGYLNDKDYVYITGRKKNVIIAANGKNVFPEELEFYLMKNECIEECMVWGDEDNDDPLKRGIYATIRPNKEILAEELGEDATDEQVREYIERIVDKQNETMPLFKRINHVIIREREFDKTTGLKIRRFVEDNKWS